MKKGEQAALLSGLFSMTKVRRFTFTSCLKLEVQRSMYRPLQTAVFFVAALLFVSCDSSPNSESGATGTLEVITSTSGDSDGYTFSVEGTTESIGSDDTTEVMGLSEGGHQVELSDLGDNCSVGGDNPRSVNITADQTTSTTFEVTCEAVLGNQIVFFSYRDGNNEIYKMDPDGSNPERLTNNSDYDGYPSVSKDGRKIAFARAHGAGQFVATMDADGANQQDLTNATTDPGFYSWSGDNSQVAFGYYENGSYDIYKVNADGSGRTQLTSNSARDRFPTWSPDGSTIVFVSDRNGSDDEIYTMDSDGNNVQQVTTGASLVNIPGPRFSPDGSRIAFVSDRSGDAQIYTMDVDGNNVQQVTSSSAFDASPTWSPDGTEIAFERDGEIYKINADGSGSPQNLTNNSERDASPFWSPVQ